MLYTRKGDKGTTRTYGCDQRISKSSNVAEALGSLDEVNSFLGVVKVATHTRNFYLGKKSFSEIIHDVQQTLFMVQAEVAGFPMKIPAKKVTDLEKITDAIEAELPPIKTFFISGGTELAASCDFARTLARRAERRVVAVSEEGKVKLTPITMSYLNRLSSLLYALARISNHRAGVTEEAPKYK